MAQKIFFLNGPPGSGKDALANAILKANEGQQVYILKFATHLKRLAHMIAGLPEGTPADRYEGADKETPNKDFPLHPTFDRHFSPREFYIYVSEFVIKPNFGKKYFGNLLVKGLERLPKNAKVLISDSGFLDEALPIIGHAGIENCFMFQLSREGKSFKDDSRNYWNKQGLEAYTLENCGTQTFFTEGHILFSRLTTN